MSADTIEIDGIAFVPAKRAARLVGYAPDYVGQLARSGKLQAKLVGRSWYVTEDSIREHKLMAHKAKRNQQRMEHRQYGVEMQSRNDEKSSKGDVLVTVADQSGRNSSFEAVGNRVVNEKKVGADNPGSRITMHVMNTGGKYALREMSRAQVRYLPEVPYAHEHLTGDTVDRITQIDSAEDTAGVSQVRGHVVRRINSTRSVSHEHVPSATRANAPVVDGVSRPVRQGRHFTPQRTQVPVLEGRGQSSNRSTHRRGLTKRTVMIRTFALVAVVVFVLLVWMISVLF